MLDRWQFLQTILGKKVNNVEAINNKLRPIIILSPGRSGSTLLQRYLNTSNDLVIWGEHGGFITGLSQTYYKFLNDKDIQSLLTLGMPHSRLLLESEVTVNVDIEWTNNFSKEDFRTAFQNLILDIFTIRIPSSIRWGFKEIRYKETEIMFLKELFPEAQFIFMLRNPIDTLSSMIAAWDKEVDIWEQKAWRNDPNLVKHIEERITVHTGHIIKIVEAIKGCLKKNEGYLVKYENLTENPPSVIQDLCHFLDAAPPLEEKIQLIAGNIRWAMNTKSIKDALYNDYYNNEDLKKLLTLYEPFY